MPLGVLVPFTPLAAILKCDSYMIMHSRVALWTGSRRMSWDAVRMLGLSANRGLEKTPIEYQKPRLKA